MRQQTPRDIRRQHKRDLRKALQLKVLVLLRKGYTEEQIKAILNKDE